jgi:DNA-3-methyladenine glycosylase
MAVIDAQAWQTRGAAAHARRLLGKHLVMPGGAHMITEVEAYDGERDLACHAAKGRTARTETLYRLGGIWYVYLCYGIHEMLNLVVGPADWPSAVLIRAVEGISGPGRLTKRLAIDRRLNGRPAAPETGLWIEDRGVKIPARMIRSTPRVGVDYAGPLWAQNPWRFIFDPQALARNEHRTLPPPGGTNSRLRSPRQI